MSRPIIEVAVLFLRLGLTSFGGPAAHIAMMRDEVVARRHWLSDREFLDLVAAANLIPGPNSTEVAIHVGRRVAGRPGLVIAGLAFILPAFTIVLAVAMSYRAYGQVPDVRWLLAGIMPVMLAIVANAIGQLGKTAVQNLVDAAFVAAAMTAALAGVHELIILATSGLLMLAWRRQARDDVKATLAGMGTALPIGAVLTIASAPSAGATPVTLGALTWFFLKVGSVLFGSGYVLLAFLRADLVERWHWLTNEQLLDAIAVGQFTPGPVFTTATFIGYILAGTSGAVLATVGIFAPAFVFVWLTAPQLPRLRSSPVFSALLDGVVLGSLGLMVSVSIFLAIATLNNPVRIVVCMAALLLIAWRRPNTLWLIAGGAGIGWLTRGL